MATRMTARKILVIEDELDVREILIDILDAEGFEVAGAENGAAGIELATQINPDLILCDVMMPKVDGLGVLETLRKQEVTATTPFIFLTAKATKDNLREGMNLGADDYVTKPFTRQELLDAIASRLQRRETFAEASRAQLEELRQAMTLTLPHELHTPLNGIIASSQYVLDDLDDLDKDEIQEFMQDINTSGRRLYRLVQNFLLRTELTALAQDEQKLAMLRSLTLDQPATTINKAVQDHLRQHNGEARGADLEFKLADATIRIAETGLQKIVVELVDNALKFSPPDSAVSVSGQVKGNCYCLTVTDHGEGMATDQMARIGAYQQFERRDREQQGTGLGLSLVQQLVELYDAQLNIKSNPGEGTTVQVSFSLAG
ncbi:MAG: response regulator [Cyanophyceae cyanobacterium]